MSNKINYQLSDGENIELELSLLSLKKLKEAKKENYNIINSILLNGVTDIFEQIAIVYTAYLCANIDNIDKCMNYDEFEKRINQNAGGLTIITNQLLSM